MFPEKKELLLQDYFAEVPELLLKPERVRHEVFLCYKPTLYL